MYQTATHALTLLRRSNGRSDCIALFYKSRILSVLSFACPVWYPYLSQTEKERLENFQSLCTRIILPDVDDYDSRLSILKLEELRVHLDILWHSITWLVSLTKLEEQRSLIKFYSSCLHKYLSLSHGLNCIPNWPVKIKYIYITLA